MAKKNIKIGKISLNPQIYLNEKNHKVKGQIPYFLTVESVLQKEKRLKLTMKRLQIEFKEDSPLDVCYADYIMKLIGLPEECDMPKGLNWDPYYNDYTGMVYGDQEISTTLNKWEKQLKTIRVPYNPKNHKKLITKFLAQEAELFQAVQALGVKDQGPFGELISDWNLAYAVLGLAESDELNQALREVVELGGDSAKLVKTFVK